MELVISLKKFQVAKKVRKRMGYSRSDGKIIYLENGIRDGRAP
jgi:hypothetical protein